MAFCTNCGIKTKGSAKFCPDNFLNQFQGYWVWGGIYDNDISLNMDAPKGISITENALHIGTNYKPNPTLTFPLPEMEYKVGALYFSS